MSDFSSTGDTEHDADAPADGGADAADPTTAVAADPTTAVAAEAAADPVPITIYTRVDCSLCDVAKETVTRVAADIGVPVDVRMVDIDTDPQLAAEYGERVPYGLVDGHPSFKFEVDERKLRLQLLAAC